MIEDVLFLALGFCVAVVLALALLPLLWARALRLTRQRLELLVPWSKSEIDAERDGLRAQAAVEQRRLEQAVERNRSTLAQRDVVLGQRTVDLVKGEIERDALLAERSALRSEVAECRREAVDADGQRFATEKALHDADARLEGALAAARAEALRFEVVSISAEERRGTIASLETRIAGLTARLEDRDDAFVRLRADLAEAQASHDKLVSRHQNLDVAHTALRLDHAAAQQTLADERQKAGERDLRLQSRSDALAAAEIRIGEQEVAMTQKDARLEALQRRFDALTAELANRTEGTETDTARDARLRSAIVAAGDDALQVLSPRRSPDPVTAPDLMRGQP